MFKYTLNHALPECSIGWLPVSLLIQHRTLCAMMDQYTGRGIQFNPQKTFRIPAELCGLILCIALA